MRIKGVMCLYGIRLDSKIGSCQIYKIRRVTVFMIDETIIRIITQCFWVWFCIVLVQSSFYSTIGSEYDVLASLLSIISNLLY
jgi:hypothetical protein